MSTSCITLPETKQHQLNCYTTGKNIIEKFLPIKPENTPQTKQEIFYRYNGTTKDKIIEYNITSGEKLRITYFDYFEEDKIKKIEEFENGTKILSTSFSLFKSVTEYDKSTGQRFKTTNYNINDNTKIASIYDYDIKTGKIARITVFRPDGNSVAFIKELDADSGLVTRCINYKKNSTAISSISKFEFLENSTIKTTYYYNIPIYLYSPEDAEKQLKADSLNRKILSEKPCKNKITKLIDNLYKNPKSFSSIKLS